MSSDVVRVKLRIHNNLYNVKMSPSSVTDVLKQGLNSTTVQSIMKSTPESMVTGQFAKPVEILSAVNMSEINIDQQEEKMEIEV